MKRAAIIQSSYIPWKGYFDIINKVDEFILFDDVQYTRRDWRNRNRIKSPHGTQWLTIPVEVKGKYLQKIEETEIADPHWATEHWETIKLSYHTAPFFNEYKNIFEPLYLNCIETHLSIVNRRLIEAINSVLGITTRLSFSSDYPHADGKSERLISLCKAVGATQYISGPSAKDYMNLEKFEAAGIKVTWMDYSGYPEYNQLYPPFEHAVTILDLIFHTGPDARRYMKSFSGVTPP